MRSKEENLIFRYNQLLNEHCSLQIIEWKNGCIVFNNNVIITGDDVRRFRVRVNSPLLLPMLNMIYSISTEQERKKAVRKIQANNAKKQNIAHWNQLPTTEKEARCIHLREIQQMVDRSTIKMPAPWNKGKTKHTDERLKQSSERRTGANNPMFGTRMSEEEKKKKSMLIKQRIERGEWTPNIHNSRTHWECSYAGKKYRSSWEAMYASLNPDDEYEKTRIRYTFEGEEKIYMVDFTNTETKILTEIKPQEHMNASKFNAKCEAAIKWCSCHGFEFRILNQKYFTEKYADIRFDEITIPNLRQKIMRMKYETEKANRNTKT